VGCGYHPFKGRITNIIGIDPYNNCADYEVDILDYKVKPESHDVIMALGSINFNSRDEIESRFAHCVALLKPGGKFFLRANPGITHKTGPYVEIFPWTFEVVNEFAEIAHALGISVHETLNAADTKPYGFMKFNPSAGVGGHCIPVDPSYLAHAAAEKGVPATFIERANEVNLEMPKYIVERVVADNGGSINGKSVQVVGVAYKPNVADVRETPAEIVISELEAQGAFVLELTIPSH
jgi:hypothetical protein